MKHLTLYIFGLTLKQSTRNTFCIAAGFIAVQCSQFQHAASYKSINFFKCLYCVVFRQSALAVQPRLQRAGKLF